MNIRSLVKIILKFAGRLYKMFVKEEKELSVDSNNKNKYAKSHFKQAKKTRKSKRAKTEVN